MFQTRVSQSHFLSLDEFITRLAHHDEIESITVLGSGAGGTMNPASDYDVLVVLSDLTVPVSLILTTIGQRLAEVVFFSAARIEQWLSVEMCNAENQAGPILRRLQKARVAFDRTGRITRLYEKALSATWDEERDQQAIWEAWFSSNYDLLHTKRLLTSTDPIYLMAGELKMSGNVYELLKTYFLMHHIPWSGEKEAIRYLTSHDPTYLELFQRFLAATNRESKGQLYEKIAELALAPVGALWDYEATAIELQTEGERQPEQLQAAFAWWERMISQQ